MATTRLSEIQSDCNTYSSLFTTFLTKSDPTIGGPPNVDEIHSKVIVPYISALLKNIEKRFGDSAGQISNAASIFDPANVTISLSDQFEKLRVLSYYFKLDENKVAEEWTCFRTYLSKHPEMTSGAVFRSLITTDLSDAFTELAKIAGIVLSSPIGTSGKAIHKIIIFYSFQLSHGIYDIIFINLKCSVT